MSYLIFLQDKAIALVETSSDISSIVEEMNHTDFTTQAFSELLSRIQRIVDHLNLENYSNLDAWVATLNERIDRVLSARLIHAIKGWCKSFRRSDERYMVNGDGLEDTEGSPQKVNKSSLYHIDRS